MQIFFLFSENIRINGGIGSKDSICYIVITPAFWLLNQKWQLRALVFPMFSWKWMRPTRKIDTSLLFRVLVKRQLFMLDVTKPKKRLPSKTSRISVSHGWVWGGFSPYSAKSIRARDMPRVLRPSNCLHSR